MPDTVNVEEIDDCRDKPGERSPELPLLRMNGWTLLGSTVTGLTVIHGITPIF